MGFLSKIASVILGSSEEELKCAKNEVTNLLKGMLYSPEASIKSFSGLLTGKNTSTLVTMSDYKKLQIYRQEALELFAKGEYVRALESFKRVAALTSLKNNQDLVLEIHAFIGMLSLATGDPDTLLDVAQTVGMAIQKGQMKEPYWFHEILYVSACAAVMYADASKDQNGYTFAVACIINLNKGIKSAVDFDKDGIVLITECYYKLNKHQQYTEYFKLVNTVLHGERLQVARKYLKLKNVPIIEDTF